MFNRLRGVAKSSSRKKGVRSSPWRKSSGRRLASSSVVERFSETATWAVYTGTCRKKKIKKTLLNSIVVHLNLQTFFSLADQVYAAPVSSIRTVWQVQERGGESRR